MIYKDTRFMLYLAGVLGLLIWALKATMRSRQAYEAYKREEERIERGL